MPILINEPRSMSEFRCLGGQPILKLDQSDTEESFVVWQVDEPEFFNSAEAKFKMLLHPVDMALGTGGKNDHLAKESIDVLADWALRKLLKATIKVSFWTVLTIIGRLVKTNETGKIK